MEHLAYYGVVTPILERLLLTRVKKRNILSAFKCALYQSYIQRMPLSLC